MSDLEGAMLSDYLLLECVNKGGVADVYRARRILDETSTASGPEVAIKIFRSGYAQREAFRDYFMNEAEKIGQFEHQNILPFLEYGEGEKLLYVVTPFITTGTLDDLLQRVGGHLSATQALPIVQQLCSAIQYAHNHAIVHGNIKPSNVFVASDGRMLLTDFGIARGYDDSQQSLTRVGWGSAEYAAPEQSLGVLRPTSDIYSLGVLFFRILTGLPPFTGHTPVEVLLKHVRQAPPSARNVDAHISDAVDAVLMKALQKRSDERYASAEEFANAYVQAVMMSPMASFVTSPTMSEPQSVQLASDTVAAKKSYTPAPVTPPHPQTPIPKALKFVPLHSQTQHETPLPQVEATQSFHQDETLISVDTDHAQNELAVSFPWAADPVEWSPIAREEETLPGVPMTASDLLDKQVPTVEESNDEDRTTAFTGLRKWLPLIVIILLLISLLVALLSTFLYSGNSSGLIMFPHLLA